MITENDVVRYLAIHLEHLDYRIDKQLSTLDRGIDIEAVHLSTGERLLVEAKGGTSSKKSTMRFGKPFTFNQAKSHVSVAFTHGAKLLQEFASERATIALAFPDDKDHRRLVESIRMALTLLGIVVYFVTESGSIESF